MRPVYEYNHLCSDIIEHNAKCYAAVDAVVCEGERLSWAQLNDETNRIANALHANDMKKGDKICMFMPNSIHGFTLFWGVIKAGCVIVPLNVLLDGPSLARLINNSDGKMLFAAPSTRQLVDDVRDQLENIGAEQLYLFDEDADGWQRAETLLNVGDISKPDVQISADDSMTIIYTSGTTGTPKGIEHSHFGRLNYPYGFAAGLGINRYSVSICATPIYASGTWITMLPVMYNGGKIVLMPKFTAEDFFKAVDQEGGTHSFMVPAQYISLLDHGGHEYNIDTLSVLVSAGQTLPDPTRKALNARFPNVGLYEVYGMTEGFFTIANPQDFARDKPGTVGKSGFLEDIRIIDDGGAEVQTGEVGEIVAYGSGMMKGYYNNDRLTAETIWKAPSGRTYLRSGDLGRMDEDGFLYVSGRKKDMIKSGGINIYAVDIEDVLMAHADVQEVAVIGVPHPRWSETPIALVVPTAAAKAREEEICEWANGQLAKYQRLSKLIFCEDFPRATYGKVQKEKLRQQYADLMS